MAAAAPKYPQAGAEPWRSCFSITPTDGTDLTEIARGIRVDVGGTVAFFDSTGTGPFTITCAAGVYEPIWISRINATGTTATGILGGR